MSLKEDFKKFAMRGNVIDMAVGVIIGGAFGKIVGSLVNDVIMPPIGMALGKMDFKNLFVTLNGKEYATLEAAKKAGAPVLAYGSFINSIVDFLILAQMPLLQERNCRRCNKMPSLHISIRLNILYKQDLVRKPQPLLFS